MPKAKISISMEVDLIKWLDDKIEKGIFNNRSEAIEHYIEKAREASSDE